MDNIASHTSMSSDFRSLSSQVSDAKGLEFESWVKRVSDASNSSPKSSEKVSNPSLVIQVSNSGNSSPKSSKKVSNSGP
jgi:hypothetical protein